MKELVGKRWFCSYSVKTGEKLVRKIQFELPTCIVLILWYSCGVAVPMGKAANPFILKGFRRGVHAILRGRRGMSWHSDVFQNVSKNALYDGRNTFASFSEDELDFSWQAQHFRRAVLCVFCESLCQGCVKWWQRANCKASVGYHESVLLRRRRNIWCSPSCVECNFAWHAQYLGRSTLYTLHSTLYTLHSTLSVHFPIYTHMYTPHLTLHTLHLTLGTPHSTLHTVSLTPHTLHSTLETSHCTLYTVHFTLYTSHFTLDTPHSTLYPSDVTLPIPHSTHYTLHVTLGTPHSTLYTLHSTLHTQHSTLYTSHCTLHTPHPTLYTLHSTLYAPHSHSTLYTLHFMVTLHFALHIPHFTVYTPNSTLHTLHFTLYTPHSTLYSPRSTLYNLHTLHFSLYTALSAKHETSFLRSQTVGCMRKLRISGEKSVRFSSLCVSTSVPLTYVWTFGFVGCILFFFSSETQVPCANAISVVFKLVRWVQFFDQTVFALKRWLVPERGLIHGSVLCDSTTTVGEHENRILSQWVNLCEFFCHYLESPHKQIRILTFVWSWSC